MTTLLELLAASALFVVLVDLAVVMGLRMIHSRRPRMAMLIKFNAAIAAIVGVLLIMRGIS